MKKNLAIIFVSLMALNAVFAQKEMSQEEKIATLMSDDCFVHVPGGSFSMGSSDGYENEQPVHTVTVKTFYIGKYEITQDLYQAVTGENPSNWKGDRLPVEMVSWYDAIRFCNMLSIIQGRTPCYSVDGNTAPEEWDYRPHDACSINGDITCDFTATGWRLPTEAEWEYAAVEGNKNSSFKYSGSYNIEQVAWYDNNSDSKTHEVGTKKANALNIYDLSGNVFEWCWDFYGKSYYSSSPSSNPTGPESAFARVCRGGGCINYDEDCRVSVRSDDNPANRNPFYGFRIVRSAE